MTFYGNLLALARALLCGGGVVLEIRNDAQELDAEFGDVVIHVKPAEDGGGE